MSDIPGKPLDQPGQVLEFEFWKPDPRAGRRSGEPVFTVRFETTKEVCDEFLAAQSGLRVRGLMWVCAENDNDLAILEYLRQQLAGVDTSRIIEQVGQIETQYRREAEAALSPAQKFWRDFDRRCLYNAPLLRMRLGVAADATPDQVRAAIRTLFGVSSRRDISPQTFLAWAREHYIEHLFTFGLAS